MNFLLIVLWMLFAAEVYYAESVVEGTTITSYSGFFLDRGFLIGWYCGHDGGRGL